MNYVIGLIRSKQSGVSVEGYAPKSSVLATSYVMCIVDRTWYVLFGTIYIISDTNDF